jgi:Helitron helicase-like domain at N-terminus
MSLYEIIKKINECIKATNWVDKDGVYKGIVCLVCDRFIYPMEVTTISLAKIIEVKDIFEPNAKLALHESIKAQYTIKLIEDESEQDKIALENCMLSPRSCYIEHKDKRRSSGFSICKTCNKYINANQLPIFCIGNNYAFGKTPKDLSNLTQIELAMITPVHTYGYCFSYTGGKQKQLKGSLSYYRISTETIVRTAANFEVLGLCNEVVVLLYGTFTKEQYKLVASKYQVRADRIKKAIKWLVKNNIQWEQYKETYDALISGIQEPKFYDDSTLVQGLDNDLEKDRRVEQIESFQVYYPDGTVSTLTGGQQNLQDFQDIVQQVSKLGYKIEYRMKVIKKAVYDFKDNNLVNGCLLQFPYGRGGFNEERNTSAIKTSKCVNVMKYTQYLSVVSLNQFHTELFSLQLYNMQLKFLMIQTAGWKLRDKLFAAILSSPISPTIVYEAIDHTRRRATVNTNTVNGGRMLLGAVDAICRRIPHSNEAAKKARGDIETMQHHFGCPTYFLTVTPDDDSHLLIQIFSGEIISESNKTDGMSDEEIFALSNKKVALRIKYPGICAYFFELMIDIILTEIIGWDKINKKAITEGKGIFGKVDALTMSVEEQGRRTLHAHILIWVNELNVVRNDLYSGHEDLARLAYHHIIEKIDMLCSTKLVFNDKQICHGYNNTLKVIFPHTCINANDSKQSYPIAVSDQQLRNLRCNRPYSNVAYQCSNNCNTEWTSNEFVTLYLQNYVKLPNITSDYPSIIRRLKNKTTEFQMTAPTYQLIPKWIVDVGYNHHNHTGSCYKHKASLNNKTNMCQECRSRLPQRMKRNTVIEQVSKVYQSWYGWNGQNMRRPVLEINLQRSQYDMFQNICCPYISYSMFSCNNNLSFILPGAVAHYCTSYIVKNTQNDEVREYELVRNASERIFSKIKDNDTAHSLAFRRLLATSFAHQSNNIIGAAMASYLTRNKSHFYFSHDNVWCPLRDLENLLNGDKVSTAISVQGVDAYFKCEALHYLCRPIELEKLSVFDFFSKYEIQRNTKANKGKLLEFVNGDIFKHPSYCQNTRKFRQGVQKRKNSRLAKVFQYDFPDTALFEGNILDSEVDINEFMEQYSMKVLLLFFPYRTKLDILPNEFYTEKLRYVITEKLIKKSAFVFLQNVQDSKSNNLRNMSSADDLQRSTETPSVDNFHQILYDNYVEDDETPLVQLSNLEDLMLDTDQYILDTIDLKKHINSIPTMFSCKQLRAKGAYNCGIQRLPNLKNTYIAVDCNFVTFNTVANVNLNWFC